MSTVFPLAMAALAMALVPSISPAEDWTTTDGKTYHDVKDTGHNTEFIDITCQEGKARVLVALLPPDLQKRYHYDAREEAALDVYLKLLRHDCTPEEIHAYALQVKKLLVDPSILKNVTPDYLIKIQQNRVVGGGYLSYKLSPADAADLRTDETKLEGFILMAMEAKVNPAVDTMRTFSISDSQSKENQEEIAQLMIKRQLWRCVYRGNRYLKVLYGHLTDGQAIEPEVRPILTEAGIDPVSIDLLVGKTHLDPDGRK